MLLLGLLTLFLLLFLKEFGSVSLCLLPWFDLALVSDSWTSVFAVLLVVNTSSILLWSYYYIDSEPCFILFSVPYSRSRSSKSASLIEKFSYSHSSLSKIYVTPVRHLSRWRSAFIKTRAKQPLRFSKRFDLPGVEIKLPFASGWPFILVYFVTLIPLLAALVTGLSFFFWDVIALGLHLYTDYTKDDPTITLAHLDSLLKWLKTQGVSGTSLTSTSSTCCKVKYDIGFLVYLLGLGYSSFLTQRHIISNSRKVHWSQTVLFVFIFLLTFFSLLAVGVLYILFGVPGM